MTGAFLFLLVVGTGDGAGAGASAGARASAGAGAGARADAQVKESSAEAKSAFDRGRAAHNGGKTDEAVGAFERAVELDPKSSLYQMWLGHAYTRQLSSANFFCKPFIARRCGEAYNMAVTLDPSSVDAAEARLDFFLNAPGIVGGGVDKARAEAARIATLDAYRGGMATAKIAEHEKRWPEAERLYRSLTADYPDRTAAVDALVTILQNATRFDEAFKIVDESGRNRLVSTSSSRCSRPEEDPAAVADAKESDQGEPADAESLPD